MVDVDRWCQALVCGVVLEGPLHMAATVNGVGRLGVNLDSGFLVYDIFERCYCCSFDCIRHSLFVLAFLL